MAKAEKVCPHEPSGSYKRHLKARLKRLRRRAEKRDPENAPQRVRDLTFGWSN